MHAAARGARGLGRRGADVRTLVEEGTRYRAPGRAKATVETDAGLASAIHWWRQWRPLASSVIQVLERRIDRLYAAGAKG